MISLPKPRGFWDYALFALIMAGALLFLFWMEARGGVGWPDVEFAVGSALLFVFSIILARRGEKAEWITRPSRRVYLVTALGAFALIFGAIYADAYLFHRRDITANRVRHDIVVAVPILAVALWSWRRRTLHSEPPAAP